MRLRVVCRWRARYWRTNSTFTRVSCWPSGSTNVLAAGLTTQDIGVGDPCAAWSDPRGSASSPPTRHLASMTATPSTRTIPGDVEWPSAPLRGRTSFRPAGASSQEAMVTFEICVAASRVSRRTSQEAEPVRRGGCTPIFNNIGGISSHSANYAMTTSELQLGSGLGENSKST
jgi:hypothetical protein